MQRIQKTISEFVSDSHVPSMGPDDTASSAIRLMQAHGSDWVLVLDQGALVGIFTERDFLNRVTAAQRSPETTRMRDVMTRDPETLHAGDCITYAINRMVVGGFRNVPIVDESGRVLTVLTVRAVMDHIAEVFAELEEGEPAAEWNEWTDIGGG